LCRELLGGGSGAEAEPPEMVKLPEGAVSVTPTRVCPNCGAGRMIVIAEFPPLAAGVEVGAAADVCVVVDSS
jgi:hypothetical protein